MLPLNSEQFVFPFAIKKLKINVFRTIILDLVWYWCETWSLTLRGEHRFMVFQNQGADENRWA